MSNSYIGPLTNHANLYFDADADNPGWCLEYRYHVTEYDPHTGEAYLDEWYGTEILAAENEPEARAEALRFLARNPCRFHPTTTGE